MTKSVPQNTVITASSTSSSSKSKNVTFKAVKSAVSQNVARSAPRPRFEEMIVEAIKILKEKRGSSLQAIKKYMSATYQVDTVRFTRFITKCVNKGVENGTLVRTSGKGATGSFRLGAIEKSRPKSKKETMTNPSAAGAATLSGPPNTAAVKESRLAILTGTSKKAKKENVADAASKEMLKSKPKVVPKIVASVQSSAKPISKKTPIKKLTKLVSAKTTKSLPSDKSGVKHAKQSAKKTESNLLEQSEATVKKPASKKK